MRASSSSRPPVMRNKLIPCVGTISKDSLEQETEILTLENRTTRARVAGNLLSGSARDENGGGWLHFEGCVFHSDFGQRSHNFDKSEADV